MTLLKKYFLLIVIIGLVIVFTFIFKTNNFNKLSKPTFHKQINKSIQNKKYKTYSLGEYKFSLKHQNIERFYKVYVPSGYNPNKKFPLVIIFHGGGGNIERASQYFQFNKTAEQEKFLAVYPEGIGTIIGKNLLGSWNGGDCCGLAKDKNIDDVGFIKKMLSQIENNFNIDKNRIFSTGMSNGAIMTYRLACELSEQIAAIAPVASVGHYKNCRPKRLVPILHIHGLDDPCAPYDGCQNCKSCIQSYLNKLDIKTKNRPLSAMSVPDYIELWKQKNHCSNQTEIVYKKGDALCKKYMRCKNHADIVLCTVNNMGHVWPGKKEYGSTACQKNPQGKLCLLWKKIVGKTNTDLPANNFIWNFFKKHPLNETNLKK